MERFWSRVDQSSETGCWEWRGTKRKDGYGVLMVGGALIRAHRLSWELANGPIPKGLSVLHRCDNPPCVRPDHLFVGTQRDNLADMTAKGRRVPYKGRPQRGALNAATHLTEDAVAIIRGMVSAGYYHREIAAQFGIDRATISYIATGRTWQGIAAAEGIAPVSRVRYTPRLSPADRDAIRARYTGQRGQKTTLAREYGVSVPAIRAVLRG
jgi:HNH endonuclease